MLSKSSRPLRAALCALVVVLAAALLAAPAPAKQRHHGGAGPRGGDSRLGITSAPFGSLPNGGPAVTRYTLHNASGMTVSILDYGGIIQSLSVPDRSGKEANVTLGFADIAATRVTPTSRAIPTSARSSAATATASGAPGSPSTAPPTRSTPTTTATRSTAASRASTR